MWSIEGINHGEDYVTMPRILYYANRISYLLRPLYNYNLTNQTSYTKNFKLSSMESMIKADEVLRQFFLKIFNKETIALMCLRSKTGMIKRGNPSLYSQLGSLYKEEQKQYGYLLPIKDRILLTVINKGFNNILAFSIRQVLNRK